MMAGIKRDALDAVFSDCIRERANYTCQRCQKYYPEGNRRGLDCAHIYGRAAKVTRWHPDNAVCLCRGCHQYFTSHPCEFDAWVRRQLGETRYDMLRERFNNKGQRIKYHDWHKKEMREHYREELKKMRDQRMGGETGALEFTAYD